MTDDTRDIAIESRELGKSAHKRLDGINGQIGRLGSSHEKMREDFAQRNALVLETVSDLAIEVVEIKTTLRTALKVASVVVAAFLSICTGLTVYAVTHLPHQAARPPQAAQQH